MNKYLVRITQSQTKYLQGEILELLEFPPIKLPKLSGYAIRCWGYRGSIISDPKLTSPTSSCIHPSTHNQETFGTRLPQPSKSIRYTSYGNTPNSRPSTRWRRGYLTNNCIKEIFDVGELRYSRTATIKLWRQHLGAQLPGTRPQPLNVRRHQEQCSRHKTIGTIPRYSRDPKKIVKFEERKVKTSTSGCLTRAMRRLGSKKNS